MILIHHTILSEPLREPDNQNSPAKAGFLSSLQRQLPISYIMALIFHDQSMDLSDKIRRLDKEMNLLGYGESAVHTEPLIRREFPYQNLSPNERRSVFVKLFYFAVKADIQYSRLDINCLANKYGGFENYRITTIPISIKCREIETPQKYN